MDSRDLAEKLSDYIKYGTMGFLEIPERTFDRDKIIDQYMKMYRYLYKEK